jgi:hypothetical protein
MTLPRRTPVSDFNPDPSAAASSEPHNLQQIVAMLGNLMPLLVRLQSQAPEQPFQGFAGNAVVPNTALDQQAAANLAGDIIADSLRNLSSYLETNAGQYPGLDSCVPVVTQAAHRFGARDYAQAFNLIWHTYRIITTVRAADPRIPALRSEGPRADQNQSTRSDQAPSVH